MRKHDAESAHAGTSLTEKPYAPPDYSYTPLPASTPPKEKKGCLRTALKTAAFLIGACLALFVLSLAVVFPKQREVILELGDELSVSPCDYLYGYDFIVNRARLDTDDVDCAGVGEYTLGAKLLFYDYSIAVRVRDTTPPELVPFDDELYFGTGRECRIEDFIREANDLSGEVKLKLDYGGTLGESFSFPKAGSYRITVEGEDAAGNVSRLRVDFTVEDPPVILGIFDRHLPVGTDFDPSMAVVVDTEDGVLSESVTVELGHFDPRQQGSYPITYSVCDSHRIETTKTITLTVCPKKELSQYHDDISFTDDELKLMCDAGVFTYKPLEAPDYDATLGLIEPTLLDLRRNMGNGYAAGSGCIYRITPDYIYLLSVGHVMNTVSSHCEIMFFDGFVVKKDYLPFATVNSNELALFRIPTSDVPVDTLMRIRQIYVDPDIYSKLQKGDEVVAFAKYWAGTKEDLIRKMEVRRLTSSIYDFAMRSSLLETTGGVVRGMSGTAVVDLKGNLVGLVSASGPATDGRNEYHSFHSKIDVLPEVEKRLEKIVGNKAA